MNNSFSLLFFVLSALENLSFDVIVFYSKVIFIYHENGFILIFVTYLSAWSHQQADSVQLRSQMEYSNAAEFIYSYRCMSCYWLVNIGQKSKNALKIGKSKKIT